MPMINGLKVTDPDGRLLGYQANCPYCGTRVRGGYHLPQIWDVRNQCEHYVTVSVNSKGFVFEFTETPEPEDELTIFKRQRALEEEQHGREAH